MNFIKTKTFKINNSELVKIAEVIFLIIIRDFFNIPNVYKLLNGEIVL
jgi:hypothetical protein